MEKYTHKDVRISMGLDLGDRFSYLLGLDRHGEILVENKRLSTTRVGFQEYFSEFEPSETRIVCEAGTHSPWVNVLLEEMGFEVVVANPSNAGRALRANGRKNDRLDALTLASLGFDSLRLLRPIKHRSKDAQCDLAVIRARDCAVRMRTRAINCLRGLVKSSGARLPSSSSASFHRKVVDKIPSELKPALLPLLEQIGQLTTLIRSYDKEIEKLARWAREHDARAVVCTHKDLVKVATDSLAGLPLWAISIEIEFLTGQEDLQALLDTTTVKCRPQAAARAAAPDR